MSLWQQANTYTQWVGGRLPTGAEWEKACRGQDARFYGENVLTCTYRNPTPPAATNNQTGLRVVFDQPPIETVGANP